MASSRPKLRDVYMSSEGVKEKMLVHGGRLSARNMLSYLEDTQVLKSKQKQGISTKVKVAVSLAKKRVREYSPYTWRRKHHYSILPKEPVFVESWAYESMAFESAASLSISLEASSDALKP